MKHKWWQWLLIPFTIGSYVASIILIVIRKPVKYQLSHGCIEAISDMDNTGIAASSWGNRIIWYANKNIRDNPAIRVHERLHAAHGEYVNTLAHLILIPVSLLLGGGWWLLGAILLGQAAFGISYGGHFMIEWARGGFNSNWVPAYKRIWTERIAYRVEEEFENGKHRDAWGA